MQQALSALGVPTGEAVKSSNTREVGRWLRGAAHRCGEMSNFELSEARSGVLDLRRCSAREARRDCLAAEPTRCVRRSAPDPSALMNVSCGVRCGNAFVADRLGPQQGAERQQGATPREVRMADPFRTTRGGRSDRHEREHCRSARRESCGGNASSHPLRHLEVYAEGLTS